MYTNFTLFHLNLKPLAMDSTYSHKNSLTPTKKCTPTSISRTAKKLDARSRERQFQCLDVPSRGEALTCIPDQGGRFWDEVSFLCRKGECVNQEERERVGV